MWKDFQLFLTFWMITVKTQKYSSRHNFFFFSDNIYSIYEL